MDSANVATHYDNVKQESRQGRRNSAIINLRSFNNWLKAVLINLHTRPGYSVLDLCCGKGGDLRKWESAHIASYVGCDIAEVSVRQAAERYNGERSTCTFQPVFLVGDMFSVTIADYLADAHRFDVVSCQFAMHYAFESEARVRQLLHNVTARLQPGGFFIGTTTDANVLVRKLRAIEGLEFSNDVFHVAFDERLRDKRFAPDRPYGIRYTFTLDDRVEALPEFLVHFPTFERLAAEYGLELTLYLNFHDFFSEFSSERHPEFRELLFNMRVLDERGTIPVHQWDAIYLYTAFAFRKAGQPSAGKAVGEVRSVERRPVEDTDIVTMKKAKVEE